MDTQAGELVPLRKVQLEGVESDALVFNVLGLDLLSDYRFQG